MTDRPKDDGRTGKINNMSCKLILLKPPLAPLSHQGLQAFVREQEARFARIDDIIARTIKRIADLSNSSAESNSERKSVLPTEVETIVQQAENEVRVILATMQAAAAEANERSQRHHDPYSTLRQAMIGPDGVHGRLEAVQLRAAYANILATCGPLELLRYAQQALDTADMILADSVIRENRSRKPSQRPFLTAMFLKLFPNSEYVETQRLLERVEHLAQEAMNACGAFTSATAAFCTKGTNSKTPWNDGVVVYRFTKT